MNSKLSKRIYFLKQKYSKRPQRINRPKLIHRNLFQRSAQEPLPISSDLRRQRFEMVQIKLASPKTILKWSERKLPNGEIIGEILKPETMNYRTYKPEPAGLLCQKIFGPVTSWECDCNLPKRVPKNRSKPVYCDVCWVELTDSRVRRHRMAYVELNFPATHIWYLKGSPSYLSIILDICVRDLEKVVYFEEGTIGINEETGEAEFVEDEEEDEDDEDLNPKENKVEEDEEDEEYENLNPKKNKKNKKNKKKKKKQEEKSEDTPSPPRQVYDAITKEPLSNERVREILDEFMPGDESQIFNKEQPSDISTPKKQIKKDSTKPNEENFLNFDLDLSNLIPSDPLEPLIGPDVDKVEDINWGEEILSWDCDLAQKLEELEIDEEEEIRGAESLLNALEAIDFKVRVKKLRSDLIFRPRSRREKILRRIRILEGLLSSELEPSWMVLRILPVLPAGLRPVFELPTGSYTTSEFNDYYRLIITRNNRLRRLQDKLAPFFLLKNEKLLLQNAIDDLLDSGKPTPLNQMTKNRDLRCLTDLLCGKEGRFRENLLGKRVDYSGRSVIVVGPKLGLDQCGLPYDMAIELFNPYILRLLSEFDMIGSLSSASDMLSHTTFPILWDILDFLSRVHLIILNRAPTLHRFGIQAFQPVITTGRAIQLHPLVCPAFNADFDGDQMGVHLPLTLKTQAETYDRLLSANNFLSSATGRPLLTPSQDIVLGWYYLTTYNLSKNLSTYTYYQNFKDVIQAAEDNQITIHSPIWVKYNGKLVGSSIKQSELRGKRIYNDESVLEIYEEIQIRRSKNGKILVCYLLTTAGRILLNEMIAAAIYAKPLKNKYINIS